MQCLLCELGGDCFLLSMCVVVCDVETPIIRIIGDHH
jgi:hypothetical protein